MKFYIQTKTGLGENEIKTEKEVANLETAKKDLKAGETIHICRHEEGLPCTLE